MAAHPHPSGLANGRPTAGLSFFGVFKYSRRALDLVWTTSRPLTIGLALLTLLAGILPAGVAYVGALIVDAVVAAIQTPRARLQSVRA